MEECTVKLQSQEWRTVNEEGEEVFGEMLYVNGTPVDKEPYGSVMVEIAQKIVKAMGYFPEVCEDLEPMESKY